MRVSRSKQIVIAITAVIAAGSACKSEQAASSKGSAAKPVAAGSGSDAPAGSGSGSDSGSGSAPAAVAPVEGGPCSAANFALDAKCGWNSCVRLFEVTPACVVREVNMLDMSSAQFVADIVWPKADGPLYIVANFESKKQWAWGALENPRTAKTADLAAVMWKEEAVGETEPEGFQFGIEADGSRLILVGCARWKEDNEEEWHCTKPVFRGTDKGVVKRLPVPPSATEWKAGEVIPGISLRSTKGKLECRAGSGAWSEVESYDGGMPFAVRPIAGDRYYLFAQDGGGRMHANFDVAATVMKGCALDKAIEGDVVPGPGGLWANRPGRESDGNEWRLYRSGSTAPLTDAAGAPFKLEADTFVWAQR